MIFPYPVFQLCVWFVCYIRCFLCLYLASFNGMACICIYFAWFSPRFAFPLLTNKATNELMRWNLVGFIAVFVFYFVCFPVFKLYFIVFTTCQRFFLYRHLYTVFYVWFSRVYAFVNHSLLKYKVCSNKHVARLHFFCVLDFHCLSLFISISLSLWFDVRIFFILWFVWKKNLLMARTTKQTNCNTIDTEDWNSIQIHFIIKWVCSIFLYGIAKCDKAPKYLQLLNQKK